MGKNPGTIDEAALMPELKLLKYDAKIAVKKVKSLTKAHGDESKNSKGI
jgi:hypothetical protein